jgi:hypothetical protein
VLDLAAVIGAIFIQELRASALLSILGFTLLWSIKDLFEQEERVKKGWFLANPKMVKKSGELVEAKKEDK